MIYTDDLVNQLQTNWKIKVISLPLTPLITAYEFPYPNSNN